MFNPNGDDALRMAEEHRQRILRQMEDTYADYEVIRTLVSRVVGWSGRQLVKFSEWLDAQPERAKQPQF